MIRGSGPVNACYGFDVLHDPAVYESYDKFLHRVLGLYYEKGGKDRKVNFLALLLASGETWKVAAQRVMGLSTTGKVVSAAAGAVLVRMLLRYALGGPLGILLTGASVASLVALYVRNQRRIHDRVAGYRTLIVDYRTRFEEIRGHWAEAKIDEAQRNLMVEGLVARFVDDLDGDPA